MEGEINFVYGVKMTPLEKKKIEAELARVKSARLDMEVRLVELEEAMQRILRDVEIQSSKEKELQLKLDT
jgi:hypothetical protein